MREARRVARPLVYEPEGGVQPVITQPHEILSGIAGDLPKLRGFVLTERKDSPLVEIPLRSTQPAEPDNASLLATWTYGLGRTAVFTTDAGNRWAEGWVNSPFYDQFFSQMVRWTMRPSNDDSKYNIATNVKDGRIQIVVTALNADDKFVNFLDMNAIAVGPDLKPINVSMRQQASGRYVGELTPEQAGSYMLSIVPGGGKPPITTGVTMPFSDEYRVRQANMQLLESLASRKPVGGSAGTLSASLEKDSMDQALAVDTYRKGLPPAKSLKDIWPLAVLIGATMFFGDVFVRRVALDMGLPLRMLATRLRRRRDSSKALDAEQKTRLDRLRSSKSIVGDDLQKQRASTVFEPEQDISSSVTTASDAFDLGESKSNRSDLSPQKPSMGIEEEQSYTSRLLDAKRKAKKNT